MAPDPYKSMGNGTIVTIGWVGAMGVGIEGLEGRARGLGEKWGSGGLPAVAQLVMVRVVAG